MELFLLQYVKYFSSVKCSFCSLLYEVHFFLFTFDSYHLTNWLNEVSFIIVRKEGGDNDIVALHQTPWWVVVGEADCLINKVATR